MGFLSILALSSSAAALLFAGMPDPNTVAEAERNFAKAGLAKGIRQSFLENFANDGVVFAPNPVNAKAFYNKNPEKGVRLVWQPAFATIAASGELGFTTGPWHVEKSATDQTAIAFGQFLSIWKKQADGSWKVLVDVGIDNPSANSAPPETQLVPPADSPNRSDLKAVLVALGEAEKKFNETLKSDAGAALLRAGGDDLRVFRDNTLPAVGRAAAKLMLESDHDKVTREQLGGGISEAGDLAYRYGSYAAERARLGERGYYLTIWNTDLQGNWKILADLQTKSENK